MPFDTEQFLEVFARYNAAVFPMQFVLILAAFLAVRLASTRDKASPKPVSAILVFLWLWMGVVYHWIYFSTINGLAYLFGAFFVLQSAVFLHAGIIAGDLSFRRQAGTRHLTGTLLIAYALIVYPILSIAFGHPYPYSPTFGLPCPTTIFTLGLLLRSGERVPFYVFPIPVIWSLVAASAAFVLDIWEDLGLLAAVASVAILFLSSTTRNAVRLRAT